LETYFTEEKLENSSITKWIFTNRNKSIDSDDWIDVTRRETIAGAEQAIDASIEHYAKKLEFTKGPKVVKTFE
jgi:hypothetical protein